MILEEISKLHSQKKDSRLIEPAISVSVGIADEISNIKFIEDFDKIVNFILAISHA